MSDLTTTELLTTTRAVRKRLDFERDVDPQIIRDCLDIAIQAPTGSNSQGWRWLVVTDQDKKDVIADAYRKAWDPYSKMGEAQIEMMEGERKEGQKRVASSASYLAENMHRVPVLVIPCILGRMPANTPNVMWAGLFGSILPAVWSFQLALRDRGLGSSFTTLHLMFEDEVAKALDIPDTVTQACLIPVGHVKGAKFKPAPRRPVEEITYYNGWKQQA